MSTIDWIGFIGVFLILLAYVLNVTGKIKSKDLSFILLNLFGASLACLASILMDYLPFIILEGVWAIVSLITLILNLKKRIFKMKLKHFTLFLFWCTLLYSCKALHKMPRNITEQITKIEMVTDIGTMQIALYNETPKHRDNFIKNTKEGVFDSLLFHRVINSFMIQSGDIKSKYANSTDTLGSGDLKYTVEAEFHPKLFHKKGVLAAARDNNPERESSSTQFYIVQGKIQNDSLLEVNQKRINEWLAEHYIKKDTAHKGITDAVNKAIKRKDWEHYVLYNDSIKNIAKTYTKYQKYIIPESHRGIYKTIGGTPHLDQNYTVFGEVIKGTEFIDSIAKVKTNNLDRPIKDVRIKSVKVLKNQ